MRDPKQIEAAVGTAYSEYMDSLYALWRAAGHPDIHPDGRPRARSLSTTERAALMRDRIGSVADLCPAEAWHEDCYSPRSSQALFVEVMGVLRDADLLGLLHPHGAIRGCTLALEEVHGRTNFDGVLHYPDGRVALTVEAKFTERGFGHCQYPADGRCDGTWWARPNEYWGCPMATPSRNRASAVKYWQAAVQVFGIPNAPPSSSQTCPLWASYQMIHNIAEAQSAAPDAPWVLLYDARNPYFSDAVVGWATLKAPPERVHFVTWQTLLSTAVAASPRIQRLRLTHGL